MAKENLENYWGEGQLAICRLQVGFKLVMDMWKDLVSKAV